jgi:NADPH2:quinone reductase
VDLVGGTTLQQSLASLAYRGRVSFVGRAGREDVKHDVSGLMAGNQSLTGVFLGAEIVTDRVHDMIQRHVDDVAKGALRVAIDSTFPLRDAAAAHRHIEGRGAFGRVLLIP